MQLKESSMQLASDTRERLERRQRVLNKLSEAARDPEHRRRMFRAKVAGQLSALLAALGTKAATIARRARMSPPQLSRQLSGEMNLTLDTLHRIAEAAGTRVALVYLREHDAEPQQFWERGTTFNRTVMYHLRQSGSIEGGAAEVNLHVAYEHERHSIPTALSRAANDQQRASDEALSAA